MNIRGIIEYVVLIVAVIAVVERIPIARKIITGRN